MAITKPVLDEAIVAVRDAGRPLMMLVKMISDMPLPMPRCVMTSPSHMMSTAPVTMVTTTTVSIRSSGAPAVAKEMPNEALLNRNRYPMALTVARPIVR